MYFNLEGMGISHFVNRFIALLRYAFVRVSFRVMI